MSYKRLEELNGIQWPCPSEDHPGSQFLHARLWQDPIEGPPAPFSVVEHDPPVERLSEEYPIRLTTGRRLDSYNTGVQSGSFNSPLRRGETIDIHQADGARLGVRDGELVRVVSRRARPGSGDLRQAQSWLRRSDAQALGLEAWYRQRYQRSGRRDAQAYKAMRYYAANAEIRPFEQPYYWAGFIFSGV